MAAVQCDPEERDACDAGCGGGLMTNAYKYVEEAGGLELESDYPYTGRDGKCSFDSKKVAAKVSNFTNIPVDEDQMAAYLVKSGPLASKPLCSHHPQILHLSDSITNRALELFMYSILMT